MKKLFSVFIFLLFLADVKSQSFDDERTSMINYLKRMFNSEPFEGAKQIEGEKDSYIVVAITLATGKVENYENQSSIAFTKAQENCQITFAAPCIKFEMIGTIQKNEKITYLFTCELLSEFVKKIYLKTPFEGSRILLTPGYRYFVSVLTLDNFKYTSTSIRDRVALIKAKQQANSLFNGSIITSDLIIKTEEKDNKATEVKSTELIREQSFGFIDGIELLKNFEANKDKTTYIYFKKLN